MSLGVAQVGPQPQDDLRRVAVGEEVGESRLRRARGTAPVEDHRGGEVRVAEARRAGDPVLGGDRQREFTQLPGRYRCRHPGQLAADLDHGLVEKGRRPGDELDRLQFGELGARPGDRLRPRRQLPGEAAFEAQQLAQVRGQQQLLQVTLGEDDDRVFAERLAQVLRRPVCGRVGVDQGAGPGVGRQRRRQDSRGDGEHGRYGQDSPGVPGSPGGDGAQSIESGPVTSALRNCATKAFSESNNSFFGPDSTILPFHRTARKSAIRRAVLRSWLIVR